MSLRLCWTVGVSHMLYVLAFSFFALQKCVPWTKPLELWYFVPVHEKKAPRVNIWCKVFICERGILYLEQAVSNLSQSKSVLKVSAVLYSIAIITWSDVCVCVCVCVCVRARSACGHTCIQEQIPLFLKREQCKGHNSYFSHRFCLIQVIDL